MEKKCKGRSRPMPDAGNIKAAAFRLEEAIANESQNSYVCNYAERKPWEVTLEARDGAVHVLRFLKFWFQLPHEVFFTATAYMDQFLARMKVQGKYLSCLSVSCFKLAADHHGFTLDASQLVILSQSHCSVKDMERMSGIVAQKLNVDKARSVQTALDLLRVYMDIFKCIAVEFTSEAIYKRMLKWDKLCTRLETLLSDSSCALYNPSVLALAFIQAEIESFLANEISKKANYHSKKMFIMLAVMIELQSLCKSTVIDFIACYDKVKQVLSGYDSKKKSKHCQKLTWQFSSSTVAIPKMSEYYYLKFESIQEE